MLLKYICVLFIFILFFYIYFILAFQNPQVFEISVTLTDCLPVNVSVKLLHLPILSINQLSEVYREFNASSLPNRALIRLSATQDNESDRDFLKAQRIHGLNIQEKQTTAHTLISFCASSLVSCCCRFPLMTHQRAVKSHE